MAQNDIGISDLTPLAILDITDDTKFVVAEGSIDYHLTYLNLKTAINESLFATRPLGEMSLDTPIAQTFDGTFSRIVAFDKIQFERGVDANLATHSITTESAHNYRISASLVADFANGDTLELAVFYDGIEAETLGSLAGRGAGRSIYLGGSDIDPLASGVEVALYGRDQDGGSFDVNFTKVRLTVERV